MRKVLFLALVMALMISCRGKGSVDGNVYWKYNNYVGNKPDAGAIIHLFPTWNQDPPIDATCDVQGNFKINDVPGGYYLAIIESNNTKESTRELYGDLYHYGSTKVLGFDFSKTDSALSKKASDLSVDLMFPEINSDSIKIKEKIFHGLFTQFIESIPDGSRFIKAIPSFKDIPTWRKLKFKHIKVKKDKNTNIIADFGVTYY